MKRTKIFGISGLMILLLIIPIINAVAISSWPVQKNDELNFSLSYQFYDENNTLIIDSSVSISIVIKKVDINLTYDVSCDVNNEDDEWGNGRKEYLEGSNLTSGEEYLMLTTVLIYEASSFAEKENYWAELINFTKEYFWADAYTFTTYSADEITNMEFSSSSDAYGYEITASWDEYKNLPAGSRYGKREYSKDGVLLIREISDHWVEGGGSDFVLKRTGAFIIPGFPYGIFGVCSILGIVAIFLKNKEKIL